VKIVNMHGEKIKVILKQLYYRTECGNILSTDTFLCSRLSFTSEALTC